MARVTLESLEKRFPDGTSAVQALSLEIPDGEFCVLVGPSGCGKSTTLRMIAGLETLTAGVIRIGERVVNEVPPKERDIAMVFQNYALYPHMTVHANMAFGLRMRGMSRAEADRKVREAADMLELTDLLERRPKALSGGQRQRVALGRAIVREPSVFLFDEPLSNLDAKLRVQMRAELSRLHRRLGATMIYVTHDQVEAMTMGQRLAVMNGGTLRQAAAPMEIYDRPADRFTAEFIGSPAMNFTRGRLAGSEQFATAEGPWRLPAPVGASDWPESLDLGVRPEGVSLTNAESGDSPQGTVVLVEPLGSESLVHVDLDDAVWVVRSRDAELPRVGEVVCLSIRPGCTHFFDAGSGAALRGMHATV
ncbi:MAG: sn-glycerol-3-phosphate ABC transporter ATP-binding protein UgpC [Candidatus Hydrogenedens sp.]|nr:sn-glycerol-3-phosphate ABC transporter ATP-binding protein UgpC [Candidatus Hydrogenedens sp.]